MILRAPYYRDRDGRERLWRKPIEFDFGNGLSVHGFAAIRETANTARAGFALFRRGRVSQGSGDEGYRPQYIFGSSNSFRYQRIFGELHLEGFEVSHTKDGFRWDENEEPFLELLKEHLDTDELPLLKQCENYRSLASKKDRAQAATKALDRTSEAIEDAIEEVLPVVADRPLVDTQSEPL